MLHAAHARASVLTLCALTATQSPLPQTVPGPVDPSFVRVLEAAERGGGPGVSWLEFCTSMSNHRGRADLQLRACDCLTQNGREIAPPDRSLSPTALGPELVTAVLGAMRSHRKNTRLVEACLRCIATIGAQGELRLLLFKHGGIRRILSEVDRHPSDHGVQEAGCAALSALAVSCDVAAEIQSAGGSKKIIAAMERNKMHAGVQFAGCKALRNLAVSSSNRQQIASNIWCLKSVLDAMKLHPLNERVLEQACIALANLTANQHASCCEIAQLGGIDIIINSLEQHQESEYQERAILCLRNLSAIESNQLLIQQKGGVAAVARALSTHMATSTLAVEACKCLANLARLLQNRDAMLAANCEKLLLQTLDAYPKNADMREQAIIALYNLSFRCRVVQSRVRDLGGQDKIMRAVSDRGATQLTCHWGEKLLHCIANRDVPDTRHREGVFVSVLMGDAAHLNGIHVDEAGSRVSPPQQSGSRQGATWSLASAERPISTSREFSNRTSIQFGQCGSERPAEWDREDSSFSALGTPMSGNSGSQESDGAVAATARQLVGLMAGARSEEIGTQSNAAPTYMC